MKTIILKRRQFVKAQEKSNARKKLANKVEKNKNKREKIFMKRMHIVSLILLSLVKIDFVYVISQMVVELKENEITILFFLFLLILLLYTSCSFIWSFLLCCSLFYLSYFYKTTDWSLFFDLYGLQMKKVVWEFEELFLIYDQILLSFGFDTATMEKLSLIEVKKSLILASKSPEELKDQIFAFWSEISKSPSPSPYDWELFIDWKWIIEYLRGKLGAPLINRLCFGVGWFIYFQYDLVFRLAFLIDLGSVMHDWRWRMGFIEELSFLTLLRLYGPYTIHNPSIFFYLREAYEIL